MRVQGWGTPERDIIIVSLYILSVPWHSKLHVVLRALFFLPQLCRRLGPTTKPPCTFIFCSLYNTRTYEWVSFTWIVTCIHTGYVVYVRSHPSHYYVWSTDTELEDQRLYTYQLNDYLRFLGLAHCCCFFAKAPTTFMEADDGFYWGNGVFHGRSGEIYTYWVKETVTLSVEVVEAFGRSGSSQLSGIRWDGIPNWHFHGSIRYAVFTPTASHQLISSSKYVFDYLLLLYLENFKVVFCRVPKKPYPGYLRMHVLPYTERL